jgi:hypothetical protein
MWHVKGEKCEGARFSQKLMTDLPVECVSKL